MLGFPYSIIAIGAVVAGLFGYIYYSESKIESLQKTNVILEQANQSNQESIRGLEKNIQDIISLNETLRKDLDQSEEYRNNLTKTLSDHNLTILSLEKPGLIEKRINSATELKFKELQEYTNSLSNTIK